LNNPLNTSNIGAFCSFNRSPDDARRDVPEMEDERMYKNFLVEAADSITVVTLNRPEKRNPINEEMLAEFEQIALSVRDNAEARAVILTGTGNSFCAGADLSIVKGITDVEERQRLFAQARNRRARLIGRSFALFENLEQSRCRGHSFGCLKSISGCHSASGRRRVCAAWWERLGQKRSSSRATTTRQRISLLGA
jgi:hypothetical protein